MFILVFLTLKTGVSNPYLFVILLRSDCILKSSGGKVPIVLFFFFTFPVVAAVQRVALLISRAIWLPQQRMAQGHEGSRRFRCACVRVYCWPLCLWYGSALFLLINLGGPQVAHTRTPVCCRTLDIVGVTWDKGRPEEPAGGGPGQGNGAEPKLCWVVHDSQSALTWTFLGLVFWRNPKQKFNSVVYSHRLFFFFFWQAIFRSVICCTNTNLYHSC